MNICFQIGLGLLPGTIITIILLIKRRAFHLNKIIITLMLTAGCGTALFFGGREFWSNRISESQLSKKEMLLFANALAAEGAYDEAEEIIDEYSRNYGYDDECRLLNARINLLKEDYEGANSLYIYLCENTKLLSKDAEEAAFASAKCEADSADLVMMNYLQSVGEKIEDYGYENTSYEAVKKTLLLDFNDIKTKVYNEIENAYPIPEDIKDCAETVYHVSKLYADLSEEEQSSTNKYKKAFAEIESESPEFMNLECVKKAGIKANVLAGDYDAVTERLKSGSSYHELMISAELYMSGLVKKSDFSDEFQKINSDDAISVANQVNKIYENNKKDLSVQERKNLKARVYAVSSQLGDPVLLTIKEELTTASEKEAGTDKTKVCLELAKIEDYFGNETSADNYLSEAIYSSQDCRDDSYVSGMAQIITVISNDEDSDLENIKNVSEYVETVLDHSLTVNVEAIVSPRHQNTDTASESGGSSVDFFQTAVDYVSRIKSSISIGKIDTSDFEKIAARVQIDSDYIIDINELKNAVKVYDCGAGINEFDLEKIEYDGSNIMLVCDVSGSMSTGIQDLREAVKTFIADKNTNENLSVVTFNDSIVETKSFGTSNEDLISFAENMSVGGGTDMFSAVINCLGNFSSNNSMNNVLILMTDGQDNNPKSDEDIYKEIGELALRKGVTVYTMGLGTDVDTSYLNMIAKSGNGEFVYVSDSVSLTLFYDMLHSQLYSQYELTYMAQDTMTMSGRTLEVTLPSEKLRDIKTYSLEGAEDEEAGLKANQGISISAMSPRYIYKGLQDIDVKLKGNGFDKDSEITVKLNGNIDYIVDAAFVDKETYKITIPASAAVGSYDVEVTIGGKKKVLQNGFSVIVQGEEKKTAFGPYVFTSAEKIENKDGSYTLRGAVTMNGWLHFKGDINLSGDLDSGGSIRVIDDKGSYVEFDQATAEGIGSFFAEKGISLDLPALHNFTLYNDQVHIYDYDNYQVDDISTGVLQIYQLLHLDSPVIRLYPDSMGLYYSAGTTIFPYQNQILKAHGSGSNLFTFSCDGSAQVTNKNIGIVLDVSYGDLLEDNYNHQINLLNSPVYFNGSFHVKINTLKNEYMIGAMIRMAFFAKQSGLGAEISWKGHLIPDSVKLSLELAQAVKLPTTVPIEVNDFSFKVSDISEAAEKGNWASLKFTGSASFSSLKLKEYFPALEKFVGDISLFEMPDTSASIRVSPFQLEAEAKLNFLKEITLAEAEVKLGNFDYTNSLLQLDNVNVNGLSARLKTGFMWNSANDRVSLEVSGTGELDAHTRFVGVDYTGTVKYDISWWLINIENSKSGTVALGLYTTHDGKLELIFAFRYQDSNGKVKGNFYYIDENGKCGKNNGTLN